MQQVRNTETCFTNMYFTLIILMHQQMNPPVIPGMMRRFMVIMTQQILKMMAGLSPMENHFILPKTLQTIVTVLVLVQATLRRWPWVHSNLIHTVH